jgi:Mce-associated membrane protein
MADRNVKKPVVGSRAPSSAPRRVAGRPARPNGDVPATDAGATEAAANDAANDAAGTESVERPEEPGKAGDHTGRRTPGLLTRRRTTTVLSAVLAVLVLVVGGLVYLLVRDTVPADVWRHDAGQEFVAPATDDHPVTINSIEWRNATEAATRAVTDILTVDWKTYDEHLEAATRRMTPSFAEEYEVTAGDSRDRFLQSKADYDFAVVGQSVVSATEDELTSLLFLNQFVYKGEGRNRVGPDVYQVRVVVTAVREGDEWLVDRLDAL